MRKVRFAYQIRFILVILLGIVLVTAPYIFSPYSPRWYNTHETVLVNKVKEFRSEKQSGKIIMSRLLNVTFEYKDHSYYGQVIYCQRFDAIEYQDQVESLVDLCESSMKFDEKIEAYQASNVELTPTRNVLYLESDIYGQYEFELFFAAILALVYIVFTVVFEVCSVFYIEFRWRQYFTLVKANQTPRPKTHRSDESLEPFVVQKANYDRFGRMTMKRGCLICPKLEEGETVQKKYELEGAVTGRKTFRPKSNFWKVMASSSRHRKELVVQKIKVPFTKVLLSFRGLKSVVVLPGAMVMIVFVMCGLLFAFYHFQGPVMALSAICVISSIICLYVIAAVFEFFGGIVQLFTEQVILTDSRIIFCWLERFNHKVEYLYYDDIENIVLEENSKLIHVTISDNLTRRLETITSERNLTDLPMSFFQYLEHLERDQVVRVLENIKEAKLAYAEYESDVEEGQDEELEDGMGEDGMGNNMEMEEMNEDNTIQLDLMAEDDEEGEGTSRKEGNDEQSQNIGLLDDLKDEE